jgi:hypothetical protein
MIWMWLCQISTKSHDLVDVWHSHIQIIYGAGHLVTTTFVQWQIGLLMQQSTTIYSNACKQAAKMRFWELRTQQILFRVIVLKHI